FGRLFAMVFLRFPKHSGGPLQWGRIKNTISNVRYCLGAQCKCGALAIHGPIRSDGLGVRYLAQSEEPHLVLMGCICSGCNKKFNVPISELKKYALSKNGEAFELGGAGDAVAPLEEH
ncbi:hypothetical protein, partial [uncultured Roseobacter sp.]|uniref:hypothetical protein n=1 Tax=uncultured Roseobacter sp. TaxID=114847 RepID=UPI00262DB697